MENTYCLELLTDESMFLILQISHLLVPKGAFNLELQTHSMSMAAPVLGLSVSPDDNMMAVGMGNLLAIHRRSSMKEVTYLCIHQIF